MVKIDIKIKRDKHLMTEGVYHCPHSAVCCVGDKQRSKMSSSVCCVTRTAQHIHSWLTKKLSFVHGQEGSPH
jgi:hypothetical protein